MISLRDVVTGFGNRDPLAEVWRRNLRGGSAEITGVPPLRYIGDGRALTDYLISGNTVQDGTPTPDAPVDVVGCGTDTASGYKLPVTVNGTEYPIYLGQVETTRRIKKLALTGEETYVRETAYDRFYTEFPNAKTMGLRLTQVYCTHFLSVYDGRSLADVPNNSIYSGSVEVNKFFIKTTEYTTAADFKSYLAAQYANGTPVTVWYVLAEPETAVVNEPLMKIGDYADTVSAAQAGVTIPTVSGANVLDVPTEVKPSQITIKGGIRSV